MIVLDTNVISAVMAAQPDPAVVAWLDRQPPASVWTTAVTIFEITDGIERLPAGRRRDRLTEAFQVWREDLLEGRILAFDTAAALAAGAISAALRASGRPPDVRDVAIAGIVVSRRATLATRNTRHFSGHCDTVNPWEPRDGS